VRDGVVHVLAHEGGEAQEALMPSGLIALWHTFGTLDAPCVEIVALFPLALSRDRARGSA
jgi:hypothetical protein